MAAAQGNSSSAAAEQTGPRFITSEQVQLLEALFNECPSPSAAQVQTLRSENPGLLGDLTEAEIHAWFARNRTLCLECRRRNRVIGELLETNQDMLVGEHHQLKRQLAELLIQHQALLRMRQELRDELDGDK